MIYLEIESKSVSCACLLYTRVIPLLVKFHFTYLLQDLFERKLFNTSIHDAIPIFQPHKSTRKGMTRGGNQSKRADNSSMSMSSPCWHRSRAIIRQLDINSFLYWSRAIFDSGSTNDSRRVNEKGVRSAMEAKSATTMGRKWLNCAD